MGGREAADLLKKGSLCLSFGQGVCQFVCMSDQAKEVWCQVTPMSRGSWQCSTL